MVGTVPLGVEFPRRLETICDMAITLRNEAAKRSVINIMGRPLFKSVYSDHEVEIECFMGLTERL
jgi:hypothetical protein